MRNSISPKFAKGKRNKSQVNVEKSPRIKDLNE